MIVSARKETLFRTHVSTASVRSFPRVGQPFWPVHRVKTHSKMGIRERMLLAHDEIQLNKSAYHAQKLRRSNQRIGFLRRIISARSSSAFSMPEAECCCKELTNTLIWICFDQTKIHVRHFEPFVLIHQSRLSAPNDTVLLFDEAAR